VTRQFAGLTSNNKQVMGRTELTSNTLSLSLTHANTLTLTYSHSLSLTHSHASDGAHRADLEQPGDVRSQPREVVRSPSLRVVRSQPRDLTTPSLPQVTGRTELTSNNPVIKRLYDLRRPMTDPLNVLQVKPHTLNPEP